MSVLDDLRIIAADLDGGVREARFVAQELRLVETACERAVESARRRDYLGCAMWKRLAVESTLRISWLVGDDLKADEAGELILQRDEVVSRCARLAARDLLNLRAAYKAITEAGGSAVDETLWDGVARLSTSRAGDPAPRSLSDLAVNRTQKALYAQHRLCSAVVHPGELSGDEKARELVSRLIDEVAVLAVTFARAMARSLTP